MSTPDSPPLLSILVPAYAYAQGATRILAGLAPWQAAECEVLVFDDSPGDEILHVVDAFNRRPESQIQYVHNRPALGAVHNWNALLCAARGHYIWLLHHDEFPLGPQFLSRLLAQLRRSPDVLLLDCILVAPQSMRSRRHFPGHLRLGVARRAPDYLFRRNLIGPTSALVVRRAIYPAFEPHLRWKVDVDAYVRLFSTPGCKIQLGSGLQIASVLSREHSITATLSAALGQIAREEHAWLRNHRHGPKFWLADGTSAGPATRLALAAESLIWHVWRALSRVPYWLGVSVVARERVRAAFASTPASAGTPT
jgi:hypothetical protein